MNALQTGLLQTPAGAEITVRNPATQETVGTIANLTAAQIAAAVAKAAAAQKLWAATSVRARLRILERFSGLLCDQKDAVAAVISREAGKPQVEALSTEILVVLDTAKHLQDYVPQFLQPEPVPHGNPIMKLKRGTLLREPYGVVGIISPWNYPFSLPSVQTLTALATGNAVVLKPSEFTPFSSLELQRLLREAGLDPDLLQIITGDGSAGAALLAVNIQKIIFTGSVATGKRVAQAAAARLLPVVLELGGKDPMLVLEDADVDVASSAAVWGAFMNAGQTCLSVERCYVHESIYEKFLKACVAKTNKLRQGRGTEADIDTGPMIHERQLRIVQTHVDDAIARGARLLAGGGPLPQLGPNFFAPTILADVDHSMTIMREETFGPVLPVRSFKTEDEAVDLANDSEYGLAASIFTSNRRRGEALARRIDAGTVMVNDVLACFGISEAPHGGVKASGIGRTHGRFGLEEMVWPKYVDSDRLPRIKKLWWYGYGPAFAQQMKGFVELLFAKKLTNRLRGGMKSTQSYLRRKAALRVKSRHGTVELNKVTLKHSHLVYDWNSVPGAEFKPPKRVMLDDESLRDGLQSPSVKDPGIEEKLKILHLMEDLGINFADIGLPGAGPRAVADVELLAREIASCRLKIKPNCAARTHENDIRPVAEISQRAGIAIEVACFLGSSPIRRYTENWSDDFLLTTTENAVKYARSLDLEVMYVTEDTSRCDPETVKRLYSTAINSGATAIVICDTVGHATPSGVQALIRFVLDEVVKPSGQAVRVDWHGHSDRGLAVANSLAALAAGADCVHATALGIGERVGNTQMDQMLVNLKLMDISPWAEQDLTRLKEYCLTVSESTGVPIPRNYPVMGEDAFRTATGVHAAAVIKAFRKGDIELANSVYSGVPSHYFGLEQIIEIGPMSGKSNVIFWLERKGMAASDELVDRIFQRAKASDRCLTEEEILSCCQNVSAT